MPEMHKITIYILHAEFSDDQNVSKMWRENEIMVNMR